MAFSLKIQNFGKLADATINIGNFTVFAGPNNTGKSYVSKLLYSIFDAMNANHAKIFFDSLNQSTKSILNTLETIGYKSSKIALLRRGMDMMSDITTYSGYEFKSFSQLYPALKQLADEMICNFQTMQNSLEEWLKQSPGAAQPLQNDHILGLISNQIGFLQNIDNLGASGLLVVGISIKIDRNLIDNFQISNIQDLKRNKDMVMSIDIDRVTNFKIDSWINFSIDDANLRQWQKLSKVIYLESPFYWKLRKALVKAPGGQRFFHSDRESLSGVPGYFHDLMNAMEQQLTGKVAFPETLAMLNEILGGKIIISETGELLFLENDREFSMHSTATGIANLGFLALLIEKKVLDKETFLFIDEPEAHLHPAWQVVMAETLFELARQGVNVVIATHSADILKWIEVQTKKNPDDRNLIALNHFTPNGVKNDEEDFEVKLADIKKSLTEPFLNLHLKGLGL